MSTHNSQIETAISRLAQTAYGTERGTGDDFRRIISNEQNVVDLDTAFEDDANYDTGSDLADDIWAVTNDSSISIPTDLCFQDIGYWLHMILGGYAVSGSDPYTHIFTPQDVDSSRQLPSRTILKKYGGLNQLLMPDAVLESMSITGGKTGRIKVNVQAKGSGEYNEDASGYTMPSLEDDREWAYNGQALFRFNDATGTAQVETATVAGTATADADALVTITSALYTSAKAISVAITNGDTATVAAGKIRDALVASRDIQEHFAVSGSGTSVILTARVKAADDATLNIAIDENGTGLTDAATSADTTAGVAGDYQNYTCALETWTLNLNNPAADDGYRACSDYLVDGDPKSGAVRSEYLVGQRDYTFNFTARSLSGDKMRGWLKAGTEISLEIPILGTDANDHSLRIEHTKCRVMSAKDITDAGGGFIGKEGTVKLMADSGTIPLTATLINDVASYVS